MKIFCINTQTGLVPCGDDDYESKKTLKLGQIYSVDVKVPRNYAFHKKYFALINLAWEYLPERLAAHYVSKDNFRKDLELCAGSFDRVFSVKRNEFIEQHRSISFSSMSEAEFSELYERVKDVLFSVFLKDVEQNVFLEKLIYF